MTPFLAAMLNLIRIDSMDSRLKRLAELKAQFNKLNALGRTTAVGSAERDAVLEQWGEVHAAIVALKEELADQANQP
jgi:hypothetical protein